MRKALEIIFFEDYGLYARVRMNAIRDNNAPADYIVKCVESYMQKKGYDNKPLNSAESLYGFCEEEAKTLRVSIAAFIEQCCKDVIEPEKPKPPWYVLPKA